MFLCKNFKDLITKVYKPGFITICVLLFFISVFFGLLIRWQFAFPFESFNYQHLLQGHSHVAFLGWGYLATIALIFRQVLDKGFRDKKAYSISISIITISIILMLFSFLIDGYGGFSIALLCVFGISSYVLSYHLLKDIKGNEVYVKLIRFGIYYYLVSSLATWFLAIVLVTQGKTDLYYNTVYFYLHFLYNGFFVFTLFGILFKKIASNVIQVNKKYAFKFFLYLNLACIPSYVLSILWSTENPVFNIIGGISGVLQLVSLYYLILIFKRIDLKVLFPKVLNALFKLALISYSIKVFAQLLSAHPYFVEKSLMLKPYFIIGYLHLFTLGIMSTLIYLFLINSKLLRIQGFLSYLGLTVFLISVILTELLLFLQGFLLLFQKGMIPEYYKVLFFTSALLTFSVLIVVIGHLKTRTATGIKNLN